LPWTQPSIIPITTLGKALQLAAAASFAAELPSASAIHQRRCRHQLVEQHSGSCGVIICHTSCAEHLLQAHRASVSGHKSGCTEQKQNPYGGRNMKANQLKMMCKICLADFSCKMLTYTCNLLPKSSTTKWCNMCTGIHVIYPQT